MADSIYRIQEIRILDESDDVRPKIFIRISDANDFMPIAGWYSAEVPEGEYSMDFLDKAVKEQAWLMSGWKRERPPET